MPFKCLIPRKSICIYYNLLGHIQLNLLHWVFKTKGISTVMRVQTLSIKYEKTGLDIWDCLTAVSSYIGAKTIAIIILVLLNKIYFSFNPDGLFSDFLTIIIMTLGSYFLGTKVRGGLFSKKAKTVITSLLCYFMATIFWNYFQIELEYGSFHLFIKITLAFFLYGLTLFLSHFIRKLR